MNTCSALGRQFLSPLRTRSIQQNYLDTLALIYHSKGVKYYKQDLQKAIANTQKAVELRLKQQDVDGLSKSYFNLDEF